MTALSFTVTVTRCGECPHADHERGLCLSFPKPASIDLDAAMHSYFYNYKALTATGPYACPMLKDQAK